LVGRNPYLVVNVAKNLIANHNDIWGDGTRQFITHLILISSQSDNLQERKMRRDAITKYRWRRRCTESSRSYC
jgi:hypothetical protein